MLIPSTLNNKNMPNYLYSTGFENDGFGKSFRPVIIARKKITKSLLRGLLKSQISSCSILTLSLMEYISELKNW